MKFTFHQIFMISVLIVGIFLFGPLKGGGLLGGMIFFIFVCPSIWIKLLGVAIGVITVGFPALVLACVLYAIQFVYQALNEPVDHDALDAMLPPRVAKPIDAEWTEVN